MCWPLGAEMKAYEMGDERWEMAMCSASGLRVIPGSFHVRAER